GVTLTKLARPTDHTIAVQRPGVALPLGGWPSRVGAMALMAAGTVAVLAVVPVPDGPANLTLPTLVADDVAAVGQPGAVAGPDGEVRDAPSLPDADPSRAPAGQAGGYTGFAQSMDTSVRGGLSDEIVM